MTDLKLQKRLAAQVAGVGKSKICIDSTKMKDVKEAITKVDIRSLIKQGIIVVKRKVTPSRARAKKRHEQKKKGRQRGQAKRKGTKKARMGDLWITRIRVQRRTLKELRSLKKLDSKVYRNLYRKAKGGFFRSKKHMLGYIEQKGLTLDEVKG